MSIDERRESPRHPRRLQVRFRAEGEERPTSGMTNNLSLQGAFVTAPRVFPRGTRLRLEIGSGETAVAVEGRVAHAHRVPAELRALGTSGMGIRFLPPEEVVRPLLVSRGGSERIPGQGNGLAASEGGGGAGAEAANDTAAGAPTVFAVRFRGASDFLRCFHRDLSNGGIFVRTERPRPIRSLIELEFELPGSEETLAVRGRVVQVIEPRSGEDPPRGGMGVELLDLENLLDELRPLVERLGG